MITFLLGSGISMAAGMPAVGPMTELLLAGENVIRYAGTFALVDDSSPVHRVSQDDPTLLFIRRLNHLAAAFYKHFGSDHDVNYEDIAYLVSQLNECLTFNYENPALLPLIRQLQGELGDTERLCELSRDAVEYVNGVVWRRLRFKPQQVDYLRCITDACKGGPVGLISLNHDTVLEQALRHDGISFKDGFTKPVSKEIDAWSEDFDANVKLFKPHGSVNWFRLSLAERKTVVRTDADDPYHLYDDDGVLLDFPANARGLFLAGTFNKIFEYQSPVYFEQLWAAFESMRQSSALVVIGYGFGDKAINTRIIDWLEDTSHRLILVHRNPDSAVRAARPALRFAIERAAPRLQYYTIEKSAEEATWEEIAADLP
jgi:SIR2-like domain